MSLELISCERAGPDALDALVELRARAHAAPWRREQFEAVLSSPRQAVLVLMARQRVGPSAQEQLLAACVLQLVADEVEVHDVSVRPERRQQGLGRRLLRAALTWAHRRGASVAFLEVRAGNLPAQRLYSCCGFRSAGRRPGYYAAPREDALLMRLELADDKP